eukprot:353918-Amphidinium_carterae.1
MLREISAPAHAYSASGHLEISLIPGTHHHARALVCWSSKLHATDPATAHLGVLKNCHGTTAIHYRINSRSPKPEKITGTNSPKL